MIELPADVLLIEPDEREAERYRAIFAAGQTGGCLSIARGADDALELLERDVDGCSPHLILVDLDSASAAGLDLVQRLRSDWRTRAIPILALASEADEDSALEAARAGVAALITKPLGMENFLEAAGAVSLYWRAWTQPGVKALT